MSELYLSKKEAQQFILYKQGLLGKYRFERKTGILDFVRQEGCIQFDPIDVCGKNAEIVLQSRIKGFTKTMLYELLYVDRKLIDYFDKNMSIIPIENWKYYERKRNYYQHYERSQNEIKQVHNQIITTILAKGPICSTDLNFSQKVDWFWDKTRLSRAALEHMYFCGELIIHHKKGNVRYYDLASRCLPKAIYQEQDPYSDIKEHQKWRVLQRIGALGLLWNKASDAWLGIPDLKAKRRNQIFDELLKEHAIIPIKVENISELFYCLSDGVKMIDFIQKEKMTYKRCEFIAPLDNLMWDRKLIKAIWDFDYKWEIYTPQHQRKYGYYVLPILYGEKFIGRIEMNVDRKRKKLNVLHIWYEPNIKLTKNIERKIISTIKRFEKFNQM